MVKTGYISFNVEVGGSQDSDGNIIASTKTATEFFDCNLKVNRKEYINIPDQQVKQSKFSIYINSDLVEIDLETIYSISLKDNRSKELGSFQVMNIEYLELSKRIKIVV